MINRFIKFIIFCFVLFFGQNIISGQEVKADFELGKLIEGLDDKVLNNNPPNFRYDSKTRKSLVKKSNLNFLSLPKVDIRVNLQLKPGWPRITKVAPLGTMRMFDLNADGINELIIDSGYGYTFVTDLTGDLLWYKPTFMSDPAAAIEYTDLDGNKKRILAYYWRAYLSGYDRCALYLVDENGNTLPGWPRTIAGGGDDCSAPVFADLNNDGIPEVLIEVNILNIWYAGNYIHAFNLDGTKFNSNIMQEVDSVLNKLPPVIGDLDNNNLTKEIAHYTSFSLSVWDNTGAILNGFPRKDIFGLYTIVNPVIIPWPDGRNVMVLVNNDYKTIDLVCQRGYIYIIDGEGKNVIEPIVLEKMHTSEFWPSSFISAPAIGDIDRDGILDIAVKMVFTKEAPEGVYKDYCKLYCFNILGKPLANFENGLLICVADKGTIGGGPESVIIADIDGKEGAEIILGVKNLLLGIDKQGTLIMSQELSDGELITPTIGQDELGNTILGISSSFNSSDEEYVYLFTTNTPYRQQDAYWPTLYGNSQNTGCYTHE